MIFIYFKKNNYQTVKTYSEKISKVFLRRLIKKRKKFKIFYKFIYKLFVIRLHIDQSNKKVYADYFIKIYF